MSPVIWLLQNDFRLRDNPALTQASAQGPVIPLYIHRTTGRPLGDASRWARHHSLASLATKVPLVVRQGDPLTLLPQLAQQWGATAVFCNAGGAADDPVFYPALQTALTPQTTLHVAWDGNLLHTPATFRTKSQTYYKVFTPFWNALFQAGWANPLPQSATQWKTVENRGTINSLNLLPTAPNWAENWPRLWPCLVQGEDGALARLDTFLQNGLKDYAIQRDIPSLNHTSGLSVALQEGHISPRTIAHAVQTVSFVNQCLERDAAKFLAELGWREFNRHLLFHFNALETENWKPSFNAYPWQNPQSPEGQRLVKAWKKGQTGYPLVDAGMRQLWQTGTMHNRVRMVTSSFLIKHLRMPWQVGEAWFFHTLLDASPANNAANWQWVAGSGADAAPYFRIFNPLEQAKKYDSTNAYIRTWCPEYGTSSYPLPIVNHTTARAAALAGYARLKTEA